MSGDGFPGVEWIAAHANGFRVEQSRTIDTIVLHITSGGTEDARRTARNWFANADAHVSSHYIIGRDGTVVQCVRHKDISFHAHDASESSIGIEHNVRAGVDTTLTGLQYWKSAELVVWLGGKLGIPMDRWYIWGHAEIDDRTTHRQCPDPTLNWDTYMKVVRAAQAKATMDTVLSLVGIPT